MYANHAMNPNVFDNLHLIVYYFTMDSVFIDLFN